MFFLFVIVGFPAKSQEGIIFVGRVLDKETQKPMPFATISIPQSQTGVISNEYGEFQYHIPEKFLMSEVVITYLGYKPILVNISDIQSGIMKTFWLEEQQKLLAEVAVTGKKGKTEAVDLVRKAVKNIGDNYPKENYLLYGYYRDYIRPAGAESYKNLIEAALVIEDRGFQTIEFKRTKIKLEQIRCNPDISTDSSLNKAYDGKDKYIPYMGLAAENELSVLRAHDPIRNHKAMTFSYVDVFDYRFVPNHNFHYESVIETDPVPVYCIRFDKHTKDFSTKTEYWVDGQIYICSKSFAILKFSYGVTCNAPTYSGPLFNLNLEYKSYGGKYFLNYLSLKNYFLMKNGSQPGITTARVPITPFFQYRELFVNKIVNEAFESMKPHEVINKSASLLTNKIPVIEGFWENYNYTGVSRLQE